MLHKVQPLITPIQFMNLIEWMHGKFIVHDKRGCLQRATASASTYRFAIRTTDMTRAARPTSRSFSCTATENCLSLRHKPSDFLKPPTHPACIIRPAGTPGGSPCRLSSGSWALRAVSNFPPHSRFFITGQASAASAPPQWGRLH